MKYCQEKSKSTVFFLFTKRKFLKNNFLFQTHNGTFTFVQNDEANAKANSKKSFFTFSIFNSLKVI